MQGRIKIFHGFFRGQGNARGNALVYVLIVIALFAALSFILSRNTGTSESNTIEEQKINITANQIIQTANQIKQGVDQLVYSGTDIGSLSFCRPSDACFGTNKINEIFHTEGAGSIMPNLPVDAVDPAVDTTPAPGWYISRFNNVEWTATTATDVLMVAHQIRLEVCEKINSLLFGDSTPKALVGVDINRVLINPLDPDGGAQHAGGTSDFDIADCPDCEGLPAACVENAAGNTWSFYSVIEQR